MVFEGKGKASWRDHPTITIRANIARALPGFKWAVLAFGIYVAYDQLTKKSHSHSHAPAIHHESHTEHAATSSSSGHH